MTTLHEILYNISAAQRVTVTVKYNEVVNGGITSQKMECFTGHPSGLMSYLDPGTLKHLAAITGVEDGVIQITSHPAAKLSKYKAYYADKSHTVGKGATVFCVEDIEAVNLNDALNQALNYFINDSDRKLIGINLIEGIG